MPRKSERRGRGPNRGTQAEGNLNGEENEIGDEVEDREMEYPTIAAAIDACHSLTFPTWRVLSKP